MDLAPIVLFVYNRPEHTRKTLVALQKNELAAESILYVYSDGAKEKASQNEMKSIVETRKVIKEQSWCGEVILYEAPCNNGLARSILTGVSDTINKHGKVIVLEDDILVKPTFLRYMNTSLNYFEDNKKVFHINGFNFESNLTFLIKKYYFLRFMNCWGWATWKDRWTLLNDNYNDHHTKLINNQKLNYDFNYDGILDFDTQLRDNLNGKIRTWAILWFSTIYFHNGLCLTPKHSLTENIGLDGSGTHGDISNGHKPSNNYAHSSFEKYFEKMPINEQIFSRLYLKLYFLLGKNFRIKGIGKYFIRTLRVQFTR